MIIRNIKPLLLVISSMFLSACSQDAQLHEHPNLTDGRQLFEIHCVSCHGNEGRGSFLQGIPATGDTEFDQQQLVKWLKNIEGKERKAPSYPTMSDQEANAIVNYVLLMQSTS